MEQLEVYTKDGERLSTAESVAELAGCKVATLDAYLSRGQVPKPLGTVGRTRLWSSTVVDDWLSQRSRNPVPADAGDHHASLDDGCDPVPGELRALRRWTRHDHKRPIMTNGQSAWATDSTTWATYAETKASTAGEGLGFVLNGDGIVGLDLNHCVRDGVVSTGALAILDLLPDTYAELSPSGHGVRIFCHAKVAKSHRFSSGNVEMEICGSKRFLTVTGNRLPGRPSVLADYDTALRTLTPRAHHRLQ